MSDPGTSYRVSEDFLRCCCFEANIIQTREEVSRMRSTNDPIEGLKAKILQDWGVVTEEEVIALERECRSKVAKEVEEAEKSSVPDATADVLFKDIYVRIFLLLSYFLLLTLIRYPDQSLRG